MKISKILKNIGMTILIPAVVYIFFFILCNATGNAGFGVGVDLNTIFYTTIYSGLIALAMSMNLTSGRFDFSVGATLVLAAIIGGNFANNLGLGAFGLLICVAITGAIIGAVSGIAYVLLGLPPMVISLGLAMIYEAIGFVLNSSNGLRLQGKNSMLIWSKLPWGGVLIVVVLIVLVIVWDHTKFGYDRAALASGQKIATDVGINEKKNAVICYIIAGALLGLAAVVYVSKYGVITPETGLSSSSYFMSAFLPMFIGGTLAKYSSNPIGILFGALTQAFITSGLTWMGASSSMITVLNGVIVMAFLIYTSNSYKLVEARMFKEKMEQAKAAKNL